MQIKGSYKILDSDSYSSYNKEINPFESGASVIDNKEGLALFLEQAQDKTLKIQTKCDDDGQCYTEAYNPKVDDSAFLAKGISYTTNCLNGKYEGMQYLSQSIKDSNGGEHYSRIRLNYKAGKLHGKQEIDIFIERKMEEHENQNAIETFQHKATFFVLNGHLHGAYHEETSHDKPDWPYMYNSSNYTFTFHRGIAIGPYMILSGNADRWWHVNGRQEGTYTATGNLEGRQLFIQYLARTTVGEWHELAQYVCKNNYCRKSISIETLPDVSRISTHWYDCLVENDTYTWEEHEKVKEAYAKEIGEVDSIEEQQNDLFKYILENGDYNGLLTKEIMRLENAGDEYRKSVCAKKKISNKK